jgi:hypothetical protein
MADFPAEDKKRREEQPDGSFVEWRWREWVVKFETPEEAHEHWNRLAKKAKEGAHVTHAAADNVPLCLLQQPKKKQRRVAEEQRWEGGKQWTRAELLKACKDDDTECEERWGKMSKTYQSAGGKRAAAAEAEEAVADNLVTERQGEKQDTTGPKGRETGTAVEEPAVRLRAALARARAPARIRKDCPQVN